MFSILLPAALALADEPQAHRDLAYGEPKNQRQTLDVYAPKVGKNHSIVFWIHGGGWQAGDKTDVQVKPQAFMEKGVVFVSMNYRLLPDASIMQMAGDVAKAIRWVHDHAREYGGDPDTFLVMGHSAGAQLAALVCTDDRFLKAERLSLSILKGCVPVDGDTYDVPMQIATVEQKRKDAYRRKFGDEVSQKALSPVTHIARGKRIPPFLILRVAGHPETTAQSQRLVKALREVGVSARDYPAQGKNHGTINADLGKPDDEPSNALFAFVRGCLAVSPFSVPPDTRSYGTRFQLDEDPISDGGKWINGGKDGIDWFNVITKNGVAYGAVTQGEYTDPTALLSGTWGKNQKVRARVFSRNQTEKYYQEVEIRLRSTLSPHRCTGYEVFWRCLKTRNAYAQIVRWNGKVADWTSLKKLSGAQYGVKDGDLVEATITGNVIKGFINGVEVISVTDDTFKEGSPGMGFNYGVGETNGDFGFTSYEVEAYGE
jgi:acetyl esterase/lipase